MRLLITLFICAIGSLVAEEEHLFRGKHLIASYSGCDIQALSDVPTLREVMKQAVQECGATIVDSVYCTFEGDGLTMVFLLSESHASIHTYPEHAACFVDLFTCGEKCSNNKFDAALRAYLQPTDVHIKTLIRHEASEEY